MSQELQIPLLKDLIKKGEALEQMEQDQAEAGAEEIEQEAEVLQLDQIAPADDIPNLSLDDSIEDSGYTSVQELLIEEEVRRILDRHMDHAYEEILHLINHKLSR